MLVNLLESILNKYYSETLCEILNIRNLLSCSQNFIDLLDAETFYKGLSDHLPGNMLTSEFEIIVSDEHLSKEKKEELLFYRDRFEYTYFRFLDLLFFASECKFPITFEAMNQLHIRLIAIIVPITKIYNLLEEILESILEDKDE